MAAVSIVLPAYNSASFIRQTIDSILAQDFSDWELIVVNDGSTDETSVVVREVDPRITLIEQPNQGIAAARNAGILAGRAKYVAFIDHDDYWHPEKLSAQLRVVNTHPEVGIVFGEFLRWTPTLPPDFPDVHLDPDRVDLERSGWVFHRLLQTNWILLSTALFRRDVFDRVGLFDADLVPADDWDMALRVAREFPLLKLIQPVALYRQHSLQTTRRADARNHEALFRAQAIRKFGLVGPDGRKADAADLRMRQFRAFLNHAILHLNDGDLRIAAESAWQALRLNPTSARAWRTGVSAYGKMAIRSIFKH